MNLGGEEDEGADLGGEEDEGVDLGGEEDEGCGAEDAVGEGPDHQRLRPLGLRRVMQLVTG